MKEDERGFTLVELLVVTIVSVILITGMVLLTTGALGSFSSTRAQQQVADTSRRAFSTLQRELKSALQFDNANCTTTQIRFYADIDADPADSPADVTNGRWTNGEKVQWALNGNNLEQTVWDPSGSANPTSTVTLARGVVAGGFTVTYYMQDGTVMTNPADYDVNKVVDRVRISLTLLQDNIRRTYEQDISIRIANRVPEGSFCYITCWDSVGGALTKTVPKDGNPHTYNLIGVGTHFRQSTSYVYIQGDGDFDQTNNVTAVMAAPTTYTNGRITITVPVTAVAGSRNISINTNNEYPAPLIGGLVVP